MGPLNNENKSQFDKQNKKTEKFENSLEKDNMKNFSV